MEQASLQLASLQRVQAEEALYTNSKKNELPLISREGVVWQECCVCRNIQLPSSCHPAGFMSIKIFSHSRQTNYPSEGFYIKTVGRQ